MLHGHSYMVQADYFEESELDAEDCPAKWPADNSEKHELEAEDRPESMLLVFEQA